MTPAELRAFVAGVRAEADAALARLATVDAQLLPPDLRAEYEQHCRGWRELTPDELRGLLRVQ